MFQGCFGEVLRMCEQKVLREFKGYFKEVLWVESVKDISRKCFNEVLGKGAVASGHLWWRNFEVVLLDENINTARSKKFQPLVYMWYKPVPSFCNVGALLLKIQAFYCAPFPFFGAQIL